MVDVPKASRLPTGVVTLMFTDIEGSTKLARALGDGYPSMIERHNDLLRSAFAANGGVEVVTTGDGFFVAFDDAKAGIAAAVQAQHDLTARAEEGLPAVRVGLHTGQPTSIDDDYIGLDVHRAARIAAAAHGGQIVMSEATHVLVTGAVAARDLGTHRLKGLDRPERIFQVVAEGLRRDFPALSSLEPPTNIPRRLDPLVGRSEEAAELRAYLVDAGDRLVTIHGPGGAGKTRLAIDVASHLVDHFLDGVFFVDLTPLTSEAVEMAIVDVLTADGDPMGDDLAGLIGDRLMLLVLDNFEQAIGAAERVCDLVQACPNVHVLVTSQIALRVRGEREYALTPLGVPPEDDSEAVAKSEAAQLFAQRAALVRRGFAIDESNAGAIAEICRLLDGMPLALELAAARLKVFSVQELLARLTDTLGVLRGGARDAPTRHRALSATVDWSYQLLAVPDQRLFRHFAVFTGPAGIEAVEGVLDGDHDPLDGLTTLVEHNLVRRTEDGGRTGFAMLQTIRAFALERFETDPESDDVRGRHAAFYLGFVLSTPDRDRDLDAHLDNVRSALQWYLTRAAAGDSEAADGALRLATGLGDHWYRHGHAREGIGWFDQALALAEDPPIELHANALRRLGILVESTRDLGRARQLFEQALELFREAGSKEGEAASLNSLGVVMRSVGDPDAAEALFARASEIRRAIGDEAGMSGAISNMGIAAADRGDHARARELYETALELDRKLGDAWGVSVVKNNLSAVHLELGEHDIASGLAADALQGFTELGDLDGIAESLEVSAGIAGATDDPTRAARLAGAAAALRKSSGLPLSPPDEERLDRWMAQARASLRGEEFDLHWREGAAMTAPQATRYALRASSRDANGSGSIAPSR